MSSTTPSLYCEHLATAENSDLQRLFNEVAAIRAEDTELFDYTHRSMEVYPSAQTRQHTAEKISEDQILKTFSEDRMGNHAVVIEGEVGTGKSELSAYLVHRLREQGRPILRADKDDDLMAFLTERLPDFYEEHFGEELPNATNFEQLETDITNNPSTVASYAATGALLNFSQQGYETEYTDSDEDDMVEHVRGELDQLVHKGEYAKQTEFITTQAYDQCDYLQVFSGDVSQAEAVDQWNEQLWNEIRDRYGTPPLSETLQTVGGEFEDTRPVVVFEDFSIASMEARQLRNYMERDVSEDNWDFIIAGTRDVVDVLHTQTAEDRFEFYQTNAPNTNSVPFLGADTAVDFIRPYLSYIKYGDGSIDYEGAGTTDGDFELSPPESGSTCAACAISGSCPRDLYPFNAAFLQRIYDGLDESSQSPREYVRRVFNILDEFYAGAVDSPSASKFLGKGVTNSESPADEVYEQQEPFADLAKWYGQKDGDYYVVNRALATSFGLVSPGDSSDDFIESIELTPSEVRIRSSSVGIRGREPDEEEEDNEEEDDDEGEESLTVVEKKFIEHESDVDDWIDDPTAERFTETNDYITRAVEDLIEHTTDDYTLWTDGELRYNLSSQKPPFVWTEGEDSLDDDQILIETENFRRSHARELLRYGIQLDENKRAADRAAQLEEHGTQFTEYANRWRQRILEQYVESDTVLFGSRSTYEFDDFVLASYAWLMMLDDPWRRLTPEQINEQFGTDTALGIDRQLKQGLTRELPVDQTEHVDDFVDYSEHIEQLMDQRFGLTNSAVDIRDIRRRLRKYDPQDVLSDLTMTHIDNIEARVRFSTDHKLNDLAETLYRLESALDGLVETLAGNVLGMAAHIDDRLWGINMQRVREINDGLSTYDTVDAEFREQISQLASYDQETISEVTDACQLATVELTGSMRGNSDQEMIHAVCAGLKLFDGDVVETILDLEEAWPVVSTEVGGDRFKEVSDHYVSDC